MYMQAKFGISFLVFFCKLYLSTINTILNLPGVGPWKNNPQPMPNFTMKAIQKNVDQCSLRVKNNTSKNCNENSKECKFN